MQYVTSKQAFHEKFTITTMHTWQFVLLSIGTFGMWNAFWLYTFSEKINHYEKRTVIHLSIPIIALVLFACADAVSGEISPYKKDEQIILALMTLASVILDICISFMSKPVLEKMLAENGTARRLNGVLCFILPGYYQYYIIRNAEKYSRNEAALRSYAPTPDNHGESKQADRLAQVEKLAELRQSGAISEEEFIAEKKKILSGGE